MEKRGSEQRLCIGVTIALTRGAFDLLALASCCSSSYAARRFFKIPLVAKRRFATFRVPPPGGVAKAAAQNAVSEENSNFSLTSKSSRLKCLPRNERRGSHNAASSSSFWDFRLTQSCPDNDRVIRCDNGHEIKVGASRLSFLLPGSLRNQRSLKV
jgi:hypothetical protein